MVVVTAVFIGDRLIITIVTCEMFLNIRQVKRVKVFL